MDFSKIRFFLSVEIAMFDAVLKRYALINDAENLPKEDLALKARQFGIEVSGSDSKEKIFFSEMRSNTWGIFKRNK